MKIKAIILLSLTVIAVSCNNKQSLQEFYVAKHEDNNYKAVDLPTSLLISDETQLEPEQQETLKTIKKVNILAFPAKEGKLEQMNKEREEVAEILADEKYNFLVKYGSPENKAELYYLGDEDNIDELIVVGYSEKQGFGVARVLGDDMNPGAIMKLIKSMEGDDINQDGFNQVKQLFLE